jgi:hypothetical protein
LVGVDVLVFDDGEANVFPVGLGASEDGDLGRGGECDAAVVKGVGNCKVGGRPAAEATKVGEEEGHPAVVSRRMKKVKAACIYAFEFLEGEREPAMV